MSQQRNSKEKWNRIVEENQHLSIEYIEKLAKPILDDLTSWVNRKFYNPLNGELTYKIPLDERVNATATTDVLDPTHPIIEMNLGMLREIYRDAFVFPLVSDIISEKTSTIKDLNEVFQGFCLTFGSGVPPINANQQTKLFDLMKPAYDERRHEKLTDDMLGSRFMMFELMVVWLYFHEVGHLLQRHFLLKIIKPGDKIVCVSEMQESVDFHSKATDENYFLKSQAREILADLEGVDLTVSYMVKNKLFHMPGIYLLMCAQEIMFHRFFQSYPENFEIPEIKHPNPIVRGEYVQGYLTNLVLDTLVKNGFISDRKDGGYQITYLSTRASSMAGLFWANRYEEFDGGALPTFMRLASKENHDQKMQYIHTMRYWIESQLEKIKVNHLCKPNFIEYFEGLKLYQK